MRALVTGAAGFIGRNLVRSLAQEGWEVRCADLSIPNPADREDHLHWTALDCRSPQAIRESRLLEGVDVVFHLAGLTRARSEAMFFEANVTPVRLLLEAIDTHRFPISRFVLVSSQAAAGPATDLNKPVLESDPAKPVEAYGRSKYAAEQVAAQFSDLIPTTIIRPGGVFGPGDRDFLTLLQWMRRGLGIYPGTFHQWFSPIYIDDLVQGIITAATHRATQGETYFLCHETPLAWREIYSIMGEISDSRYLTLPISARLISTCVDLLAHTVARNRLAPSNAHKIAMALPRFWIASSQKAKNHFNFNADTTFLEGFSKTYDWYKKHGWLQ